MMICTVKKPWLVLAFMMMIAAAVPSLASAQISSPDTTGEELGPANAMCPVTTDEPIDLRFTTVYQGIEVGFCCRRCRTKFEADPDAYVAELPQFQTVALDQPDAGPTADDHDDEGHAHDDDSLDAPLDDPKLADAGHSDEAEHDHNLDHDASAPKLIGWLGKFHPPATDLPIGLLLAAALAESLFIITKRDTFRGAAGFCVCIAAAGAVGAVTLGWFNGGFTLVDDDWVQTTHRWLGTGTALLTLLTLGLLGACSGKDAASPARLRFRIALFAATTLVGITGFFGGSLVYGISHYAW